MDMDRERKNCGYGRVMVASCGSWQRMWWWCCLQFLHFIYFLIHGKQLDVGGRRGGKKEQMEEEERAEEGCPEIIKNNKLKVGIEWLPWSLNQ